MLSVTADVSKEVSCGAILTRGRGEKTREELTMFISEIDEFHAKSKTIEYVRNSSLERHRFAARSRNEQCDGLVDRHLRNGIYVAAPGTYITDARGSLSR